MKLGKKEFETLKLVVEGYSIDEIAQKLGKSRNTIMACTSRIRAKLGGVTNLAELVSEAYQLGLVTVTPKNTLVHFSKMEMGVLQFIAKGLNQEDTAEVMELSIHQVSEARRRVYKKLGVNSAHGVVAKAYKLGVLR